MREQRICGICGTMHPVEELLHPFGGLELCSPCLENRTLLCERRGERIWTEDNAGSSDAPLCQDCFDDHYFHCCRCGALIHEASTRCDDSDEYAEYPLCPGCYEAQCRGNPIHDYYYLWT